MTMLTAPITAAPDARTFFRDPQVDALPEQESDLQETDCFLITDAGIEALHSGDTVPDEPGEEDGFTPDTADKVNWLLGKIADRRAAAARIRENAELMARAEDREANALEWRYGPALQAYVRKELGEGRKKSIRLYNGVLGYRTKPAGISVTDEDAAYQWAGRNAAKAIIVRLDKKVLMEALLTTGEVVDFARLLPAEEVFYIK